jgi:predicted amidohydrolase YtcJ
MTQSLETLDTMRIFSARRIVALDGSEPQAFATLGDHVWGTGTVEQLRRCAPGAEMIELDGALVLPGFNDAHCHPSVTSETRLRTDVSPTAVDSLGELRQVLAARAASTREGDWIFAAGYNPARTSGGKLDRTELDRISTRHPIAVVLFNWHIAVANTRALELLDLDDESAPPLGGEIGRDAAGRLDGWLYEQAFLSPYWAGSGRTPWVSEPSTDSLVDALIEENEFLHSTGITSYCDAIVTPRAWRTYEAARASGRLTPRVGMLLWSTYFDTARELGLRAGFGDDRLRLVGIKAMYDGALSGGTCLCRTPYTSATGETNGIQLVDKAAFTELVWEVHEMGSRICVHANGDKAISEVIDAIELAQDHTPGARVNHRIEHCSIVDNALLKRIQAAGITPVPFSGAIRQHGDQLIDYYGADTAANILPHRAFLDAGITIAGSSDYPTSPVAPLAGIESMVTRATRDGRVIGPKQRINLVEALHIYTAGSAYACGEEGRKGQIRSGQLADFIVLDTDILDANPTTISQAQVLSTWIGGQCVWAH